MKKYMSKEKREKLIKQELLHLGKKMTDAEYTKLMTDLEDETKFEGIEGKDIVDKSDIIKKKPVRFDRKNGKVVQVKTKDHFHVTKESKAKAKKKMNDRVAKIKKAKKEEQAILRKQKQTLPISRKQTPKFLAKIEKDTQKREMEALLILRTE